MQHGPETTAMRYAAVLVALMILLAGCSGLTGSDGEAEQPTQNTTVPDTPAPTETTTDDAGADSATERPTDEQTETTTQPTDDGGGEDDQEEVHPPDPEEDRLGWEDGYWYNETVVVDRSDGLNESELEKVVSRSMARVEQIRELEFEERIPVEIVTREEFRSNSTGYDYSTVDRLHQNTKWEATFIVNESIDALSVQEQNRGATVGGFYSPSENRIVIVSNNATSPKMNEITLSQELFHALQDQKWNLSNYFGRTTEANNAYNGIVEGDGNYVDYLYEQRCSEEWDCLLPQPSEGGGGGGSINVGMFIVSFQPYSDGPAFVRQIHENQGWEAVNALYETPPESTEQVIHPEKYPDDEPTDVTVEHTPSNGWEVLEMGPGRINYATFGEGGLASMFWYPSFNERQDVVVPYSEFFNLNDQNEIQDFDPYNYDFEPSEGWDGDKLYPYVNESSAETNETGYVWKIAWDSEEDASEFVSAYEDLLEYHGAEKVEGRSGTWRISDGSEFGDAYYIVQDGDEVIIVNAPSVDALDDVREGAGTQG